MTYIHQKVLFPWQRKVLPEELHYSKDRMPFSSPTRSHSQLYQTVMRKEDEPRSRLGDTVCARRKAQGDEKFCSKVRISKMWSKRKEGKRSFVMYNLCVQSVGGLRRRNLWEERWVGKGEEACGGKKGRGIQSSHVLLFFAAPVLKSMARMKLILIVFLCICHSQKKLQDKKKTLFKNQIFTSDFLLRTFFALQAPSLRFLVIKILLT